MYKTEQEILAESAAAEAQQIVTGETPEAVTASVEAPEGDLATASLVAVDPDAPTLLNPGPEMYRTFTDQPVVVLGEETTDSRILDEDGEFTFRECPQPLQWCEKVEGGHTSSTTVGVIEGMRLDGNQVLASGYLLNTPDGERAATLLAHKVASPSGDLSKSTWYFADEQGNKLGTPQEVAAHIEGGGSLRKKITSGHIVGATLVPFPAIGSTRIALNSERESRDIALVAAAAQSFSPRIWDHTLIEDPGLTVPTPLQMDENGRIFGHLAVFGQCHRSVQSECVMVPRSPSGYEHFHTSPPLRLDNGKRVAVGRLTVGTGHADPRLRPVPAAAHYDNTGACFALVRAGEDNIGVWVSGIAAPWATTEQIEQGLAAPLSGDWRNFGQGLDLIAALSVNTPGFAVQGADDDEGHPMAMVASVGPVRAPAALTAADVRSAVKDAIAEMLPAVQVGQVVINGNGELSEQPDEAPEPEIEETVAEPTAEEIAELLERAAADA